MYETEFSVAAVANHQRSTGSLIVIPRRHVLALPDLCAAESRDLWHVIRRVTAAVEHAYDPAGMYIWQGGRIPLPHIHARICPRYADEPYSFEPNTSLALTPPEQRQEIASRLVESLGSGS